VLNRAWYEWEHHAPLFRAATGISDNDVTAVLDTAPRVVHVKVVDDKHNAAMAYADAMTLDISVPDDIFERLKYHFSDKEIVELTATVAAYNCVSRFLVALDVGEKNGHEEPGRLGQ
jgi:alkylhydroperoxidase family enzyme